MCLRHTLTAFVVACVCGAPRSGFADPPASQPDETIVLLPDWAKGDKVRYEMVKTRQTTRDGKVKERGVLRIDVVVEVQEVTDDGYVIVWTPTGSTVEMPDGSSAPVPDSVADALNSPPLILELDSLATIERVRNWRQVQKWYLDMPDKLRNYLPGLKDEDTRREMNVAMRTVFASRELVEQQCTREPQLLFAVLGFELDASEPLEFDDVLPNTLGGDPIPSRVRMSVERVDAKRGVATVAMTQVADPKLLRDSLDGTLRDVRDRFGNKNADPGQIPSMEMKDEYVAVIDLASGWAESVTYTRKTFVGGEGEDNSREDTIVLTRVHGATTRAATTQPASQPTTRPKPTK